MKLLIFKRKKLAQKAIIVFLSVYPLLYSIPINGQYSLDIKQEPTLQESLSSQTEYNSWSTIESKYFTIYLEPGVDARRVQRRLNQRSFYTYAGGKPDKFASNEEKIASRMDTLLERVKTILGIYPVSMNVKIKIFKTRQELNHEFINVVKRVEDVKSFYVHRYQTIYVSEADINDSIVAHEMGHAVVDHYFQVIPPAKLAEMLAQYVDLHLED